VRIASIEEDVAARGTDVETEVGIKTGLSHRIPEADRCRTGRRLMPQFRVARDAFLTQMERDDERRTREARPVHTGGDPACGRSASRGGSMRVGSGRRLT
jgi:hypothetical protein